MENIEKTFTTFCKRKYLPARCRKPRGCLAPCEVTARIDSYEADEAPVAFVVHHGKDAEDVRYAGGKCWRKRVQWSRAGSWEEDVRRQLIVTRHQDGDELWEPYEEEESPEDRQRFLDGRLEGTALIDGELWAECVAPLYAARGGYVEVEWPRSLDHASAAYCSRLFRATDLCSALDKASSVTEGRHGETLEVIDVLIPEAASFDPQLRSRELAVEEAEAALSRAQAGVALAEEELQKAAKDLSDYAASHSDAGQD